MSKTEIVLLIGKIYLYNISYKLWPIKARVRKKFSSSLLVYLLNSLLNIISLLKPETITKLISDAI